MGKTYRRGEPRHEARFVSIGEAAGLSEAMEQHSTIASFVTAPTQEQLDGALKAALEAKSYLSLRARAADQLLAENLGVQLRKDSKGMALALQNEDVPKGADLRQSVRIAGRDGDPVEVFLCGLLRHNKACGIAFAAGRLLTAERTRGTSVEDQAKLLRMELSHRDATPAERKAVMADFYSRYTVRVEVKAAKDFLKAAEPKPQRRSRLEEMRRELKKDELKNIDALLKKFFPSK